MLVVNLRLNEGNAPPTGLSGRLTHAGDPLRDQVLQQSLRHRAPPGVQLVAVDADVEAQPVGVGLRRHLHGWREVLLLFVAFLVVPGIRGEMVYVQ